MVNRTNHLRKFTDDQVREMFRLRIEEKVGIVGIARKFGIWPGSVWAILVRKAYKDVDVPNTVLPVLPHHGWKGGPHPSRGCTDEQVLEIRRLRSEGWSYPAIAEKFGLSTSVVGNIVRRQVYKKIGADFTNEPKPS